MTPESLQWLNLLLIPAVGLLVGIKTDVASLRATQAEHARRLDRIDNRST